MTRKGDYIILTPDADIDNIASIIMNRNLVIAEYRGCNVWVLTDCDGENTYLTTEEIGRLHELTKGIEDANAKN